MNATYENFGLVDDHAQRHRLVKLIADKVVKTAQIIGRLFVDTVELILIQAA
ncbi:hypothetical protein [Methylobacter svalbardensis]|uniref:hypothetical protein n=1 Tax=Methylobacter svalbardensis TaxID=3080016 RepID=UPI0030EB50D9